MRPLNLPSDSPLEPQLPPWRTEQLWSPTLLIITTNIFGIQAPFQHSEGLHTPVPVLSPRRCNSIVLSPPYCSLGDSHPIIAPEGIYTVPSSLVTSGGRGVTQTCFSSASWIPTPRPTQPSPSAVPAGEWARVETAPLKARPELPPPSTRGQLPPCLRPASAQAASPGAGA